jgi:hypothetical protein
MAKKGSILIIDYGDNVWLSIEMAKYYEKVYYSNPSWQAGFTEIAACKMGSGFEGVEQVAFWTNVVDEVDSIMFTDVEFDGIAEYLQRSGYRVWGSGSIEELELDRGTFLESVKEAGLNVPETEFIKGYDNLVKYLKGKENVYVKLSHYRAIRETFCYEDDLAGENVLAYIRTKVGCFRNEVDFYVQKPIETSLEWGFDTYVVNGVFPKSVQFGFEEKSLSYFGKMMKIADLDKGMQEVIEKYSKILQKYKYTGFISLEVRRDKDGVDYPIDLTPRCALPAEASYISNGLNWRDVIEGGLDGNVVELKTDKDYVAETIITTSCLDEYTPVRFDNKFKNNVFPCVCAKRDGVIWRLPNSQLYGATNKLAFCSTKSDSLEKAIEENKEVCASIKAYGSEYTNNLKDFSEDIIKNLKEQTGIKF